MLTLPGYVVGCLLFAGAGGVTAYPEGDVGSMRATRTAAPGSLNALKKRLEGGATYGVTRAFE